MVKFGMNGPRDSAMLTLCVINKNAKIPTPTLPTKNRTYAIDLYLSTLIRLLARTKQSKKPPNNNTGSEVQVTRTLGAESRRA